MATAVVESDWKVNLSGEFVQPSLSQRSSACIGGLITARRSSAAGGRGRRDDTAGLRRRDDRQAGRQTDGQVKTHPPAPCSLLGDLLHLRYGSTSPRSRQIASGDGGVAVIPLTCQLLLPFHPSDGGDGFAADGCAGELCLIALADHVLAALDDRAARRDCVGEIFAFSKSTHLSGSSCKILNISSVHWSIMNGSESEAELWTLGESINFALGYKLKATVI